MRQLFCFWQFGGDNYDWCNYKCPYCYAGTTKRMIHRWKNNSKQWVHAFERLDRDIYFVLSYGEPFGQNGFYDVMKIIGEHENWEVSIVTNLSHPVDKLLEMKVAKDKRVYIHASWHPHGGGIWRDYTENLLALQKAEIPLMAMYLFWPPQIQKYKHFFQ